MNDEAAFAAISRTPTGHEDLVLVVDVTLELIDIGRPSDCVKCPVALAIVVACERAGIKLERGDSVKVYGDHANLLLADGRWYAAGLPSDARHFIHRYDRGFQMEADAFKFPLRFTYAGLVGPEDA